jgi:hypothetical protein
MAKAKRGDMSVVWTVPRTNGGTGSFRQLRSEMNTRIRLPNFQGARARCTRLGDGAIVSGWISTATTDAVLLAVPTGTQVDTGQVLAVEAFGTGVRAVFLSRVSDLSEPESGGERRVWLTVTGAIRFVEATQEGRIRVHGLSLSIPRAVGSLDGEVEDVSLHGLGAVFPEELPMHETFVIEVQAGRESFLFDAEVRYCRPLDDGRHRVGFLLNEAPRLVQARWNALVEGHRRREAA